MKKFLAIPLLALVLSTQTPVGQLLKLPLLIEHYIKHQQQQGISFSEFLHAHYGHDHNDADRSEDQQLPFKNIEINTPGFAVIAEPIEAGPVHCIALGEKAQAPYWYSPQQHLSAIFHPPKT